MKDDSLQSIAAITESANILLSEKLGLLTPTQTHAMEAIAASAKATTTSLVTLFDPSSEQAKQLLSYEIREHLATIMGYAEMLLEGGDGALNPTQTQRLHHIRAYGKMLLVWLDDFMEES